MSSPRPPHTLGEYKFKAILWNSITYFSGAETKDMAIKTLAIFFYLLPSLLSEVSQLKLTLSPYHLVGHVHTGLGVTKVSYVSKKCVCVYMSINTYTNYNV